MLYGILTINVTIDAVRLLCLAFTVIVWARVRVSAFLPRYPRSGGFRPLVG